jgi:AcrR family transcriptional regulator
MDNQRAKIVAIAAKIMSAKGYDGTSLQEIADLVGIHKSTIFHYFKTKEELLLEILKISVEEVTAKLKQIIANKKYSPEQKLQQAMRNHLKMLDKHIDNVNVYLAEMHFLSEKNKQNYLLTRKSYEKYFLEIVREMKKNDRRYFKGQNTKIVVFGILGMCNWVVKWYKKEGFYQPEKIADIFYQMITQRGH